MKKHRLMGLVLSAALFSIFLPMVLMLLWSVAGRWPWPGLLPETYSLRTIKELLTGSASLPRLLSSSILLALTVVGIVVVYPLALALLALVLWNMVRGALAAGRGEVYRYAFILRLVP